MLADFFTKALQGASFIKFREVIMGWKHIDTLQMGPPSTKERVGNMDEAYPSLKAYPISKKEKERERRGMTSYADIVKNADKYSKKRGQKTY